MTNKKWQQYLLSCNYPASLTSTDKARRDESKEYVIKATTGFDKSGHLLVLGCGDGYEIDLLKELGFENVKGITLLTDEHGGRKDIIQGDIHDMPFKDEEFDYVISKETMEHMIAPAIALMEINRVMKMDGKFTHYIPTGTKKQRDWYHYNCCPEWWWADMFYKNGFEVTEIRDDIKQIKYEGYKNNKPNWLTELYNLDGYYQDRRK